MTAVVAVPDVAAGVARARQAGREWAARPLKERAALLRAVADRILSRGEEIARRIAAETGKPQVEAFLSEVLPNADLVDYWTTRGAQYLRPEPVRLDPLAYPKKRATLYREPRGVVALIAPWNYPVAIPLRTLVPALLAGNAVVFKPSEHTPDCGALVGELFEGVLPEGLLEVVQGDGRVGAALLDADVDSVVFTGSVATGRKVAARAAERLIPCALELGGKDPALVLEDADLERAAQGVVWGALTNAGQNCASIERVYVVEAVADAFIARVQAIVEDLIRRGDQVGRLTNGQQLEVVDRHVRDALGAGARALTGGARPAAGLAYAPTVLVGVSDQMAVMSEETFGPVLPIAVVRDEDEAVARANQSRYGLTASVWTRDLTRGEAIARRLNAGVVTVNNHAFTGAIPALPWSGTRESGTGVTNSSLALHELVRPRVVLLDANRAPRELWWYPYNASLEAIASAMATFRRRTAPLGRRVGAVPRLLGAMGRRFKES